MAPRWLPLTRRLATGGAIFVYHGVSSGLVDRRVGTMHVPLARMAATIRAVKRVATIIPLGELVSRHLAGRSTKGLVAVTFDDAYLSVRSEALELLRIEQVPVTFFVVLDAARAGSPFWWDRLDHVVKRTSAERWRAFERECGVPEAEPGRSAGHEPVAALRHWLLHHHWGRWPAALEAPLTRLEQEVGSRTRQRPLTFRELDDLAKSPLIDIGPHTLTHCVLPRLSEDEMRTEIRGSLEHLRERYPQMLPVLAPPFGLYDHRTVRVAHEEGLDACVTLGGTQLDPRAGDHSLIPRFGLTAGHRPWKVVLYTWGCWFGARPRIRARPAHERPSTAPGVPERRAARKPRPRPSAAGARQRPTDAGPARRVLLLAEDLGGGTGNHVCKMLTHWSARGWHVVLVTQTPPLVHKLPTGVRVHVTRPGGWFDRFPVAQVRRLLALRKVVRSVSPDVVHTYFFWSIIYGRALRLLGLNAPLVENREDLGFSWGRGSYAMLRLTRRLPDRIICVSDAVRRVVVQREAVDENRVLVVHNGVEPDMTAECSRERARRQFEFEDDHVVIGMVANLPRAVKGGRRLLDAMRPIVTAAPSARFLLVGLGTDRETLEPELRARGLAKYVVGTGYRRDVQVCYAAMDISVLTSSSEGLSITLLESMQHGLPVVVTRVGGNPEVVVDGATGFLVPLEDSEAFVDRVVTLVRDAARRREMGEAGRRRVAEHFGMDDAADHYLEVYEDVLGTPCRDGPRSSTMSVVRNRERR